MTIGRGIKLAIGIGLVLVGILIIVGLIKFGSLLAFFLVYPYVFSVITDIELNPYLAKIVGVIVTLVVMIALGHVFSLNKEKREVGYAIAAVLFIAHCFVMFFVAKDKFFSHTGEPIKYCCRDSISNELACDDVDGFCQDGIKKQAVTAEDVKEINAKEISEAQGLKSTTMEIPCWQVTNWFNAKTGRALIYYEENPSNSFHCYASAGFSPITGKKLQPVNAEVINHIKKFSARQKVYHNSVKSEVEEKSFFDFIGEVAGDFVDDVKNVSSSIVNYFQEKPSLIFVLLMILNFVPWIWVLFYDNSANRVFNESTPALAIIAVIIFLNAILFPSGHVLGSVCFILWVISAIFFCVFVAALVFSKLSDGEKKNVTISKPAVSVKDRTQEEIEREHRKWQKEYHDRQKAFFEGSA